MKKIRLLKKAAVLFLASVMILSGSNLPVFGAEGNANQGEKQIL